MKGAYAVDLWLHNSPGGGCRKTVHGSDWHYVDLDGVEDFEQLLAKIRAWEAKREEESATAKPPESTT